MRINFGVQRLFLPSEDDNVVSEFPWLYDVQAIRYRSDLASFFPRTVVCALWLHKTPSLWQSLVALRKRKVRYEVPAMPWRWRRWHKILQVDRLRSFMVFFNCYLCRIASGTRRFVCYLTLALIRILRELRTWSPTVSGVGAAMEIVDTWLLCHMNWEREVYP